MRFRWHPASWFFAAFLALLPLPPAGPAGQDGNAVDLTLVLGIDCSYSVDSVEFQLQAEGLARAFQDPEILDAIAKGPHGRIAVSVVQWSDSGHQSLVVPWTEIGDIASAAALSRRLAAMRRVSAIGATSITGFLQFGAGLIEESPFRGLRRVIDVSADGRNNTGGRPSVMRDAVVARGITINALAILNEVPTLDLYFELQVVGGPANFVVVANDYQAYREAIRRKILMEVLGAPVS